MINKSYEGFQEDLAAWRAYLQAIASVANSAIDNDYYDPNTIDRLELWFNSFVKASAKIEDKISEEMKK